jgi:hypothetical protein
LKDAILQLIAAPDGLAFLGQRARERVRATSTSQIVQSKYDQIFLSLLQERRLAKGLLGISGTDERLISDPLPTSAE